jgi:predicted Zn-dependent peptidase
LGERLEYHRSLAGDLETLFVQGLRPKYYSDLPGIYAQLSLSEVANQSSLIQPNNFTIVVVGDSAKIEPALVQAGFKVRTPEATWLD